ncbi:DUF3231 family protein [Bacillus sp. JJ1764]|uniref:DUF3231 family protein n=1 Tax=Bacillus sp. JJ1764 TaxID=3122964 RepID=UPI002FFF46E6
MEERSIRLSSSEIGGLWAVYLQESMTLCLLTYFLHHNKDEDVKVILNQAFKISDRNIDQISSILFKENIPLPEGFTEKDLDLTAPPLFYDLFGLSFVYAMSRLSMINNSFITASVARKDVLELFTRMVLDTTQLYKDSTAMMLEKGLYDRPPMIPYPDRIEYVEKKSYISGFGKKRPLNAAEITEIFFNTERNYFSILLCVGLLQVVKDNEIHNYIEEGKKISEKQITTFNDALMREELLGNVSTSMEVTESTQSPFSDRLVVTLFHSLNSVDITLLGHALSLSMRTDLVAEYQKYIAEILLYAAKGFKIMVERGWMQKPPHAPDRRVLQKLD